MKTSNKYVVYQDQLALLREMSTRMLETRLSKDECIRNSRMLTALILDIEKCPLPSEFTYTDIVKIVRENAS